jgi:hypothetical protein
MIEGGGYLPMVETATTDMSWTWKLTGGSSCIAIHRRSMFPSRIQVWSNGYKEPRGGFSALQAEHNDEIPAIDRDEINRAL